MKTTKAALIALAILIIGFGGYFLLTKHTPQTSQEQAADIQTPAGKKQEMEALKKSTRAYFDAGQFDKALEGSKQELALDGNDIEAWVDNGMALFSLKKCPEANAALYHASMIETGDADLHNWAGDMLTSVLNQCKS